MHQFVSERYPPSEREAHAQRLLTILKNLRRRRNAEMHRRYEIEKITKPLLQKLQKPEKMTCFFRHPLRFGTKMNMKGLELKKDKGTDPGREMVPSARSRLDKPHFIMNCYIVPTYDLTCWDHSETKIIPDRPIPYQTRL